jgi:SLAP domain-containing protein
VIKANFVNNFHTAVKWLENVKVTVTNAKGKKVAVYQVEKQSVTVAADHSKVLTFTIGKADQKKQNADLRNCDISIAGSFIYSK